MSVPLNVSFEILRSDFLVIGGLFGSCASCRKGIELNISSKDLENFDAIDGKVNRLWVKFISDSMFF